MREIRTSGSMSGDGKRDHDAPGVQSTRARPRLYRRNFSGILEAILFHPAIKRIFCQCSPLVFFAVIVLVFASKRVSTDLSGLGASCSFISG